MAQVEGVGEAILGDVPLLGERRLHFGGAELELDQAFIGRELHVLRGAVFIEAGIEALGRAFRAIDQCLGICGPGGQHRANQKCCS